MKAKEKILLEAASLFSKKGYAEGSTDEIILNSGISKGLLFYHYKNKEGLLIAVLDRAWQIIQESCKIDTSDENPGRITRKLIKNLVHSLKMNYDYWNVYASVTINSELKQKLDKTLYEPSDAYQDMVRGSFDKMGKKNPAKWAFFFDIQFRGVYFGFLSDPKKYPLEKAKLLMIDMFTH